MRAARTPITRSGSARDRSLALIEFSDFAPPWVRGNVSEKRHFSRAALVHIRDQRKRCSL
jgi:hypothetical protein